MSTVSLEFSLRTIEPAADELIVGMSWRSHRDEDRLLVDPPAALYAVFDGAGGHGDGAGAASMAAEAVNRRVRAGLPGCLDLDDVAALLDAALQDADAAVAALDATRPGANTSPSATTASVAVICRRPAGLSQAPLSEASLVAVIANLGDSRVQLLRAGRFDTITLDHSYLSEPDPRVAKARQDRLDVAAKLTDLDDPMDRAAFAHRHLLANALTGTGLHEVRHYQVELLPGDRLVLDTDGVHDNLTAAELQAVVSEAASAHEAAENAVAQAWARSEEESDEAARAKPDDMTVLVLEVRRLDAPDTDPAGSGAQRLLPGATISLPLLVAGAGDHPIRQPKQYLVTAADLQLLIARRDGSWWAIQPGAVHGERGSWPLNPGQSVEFGRQAPGEFLMEPSDQVSRRHVTLALNDAADVLTVSDLHSTNGTAVLGW